MAQQASLQDLQDKVVVITGAARGMGRAHTEGFLAEGAKVVAADRSWTGEGAEETRRLVEGSGHGITVELDITDNAQIAAAYQATLDAFGTVDVLLNNAAMRQRNLLGTMGEGKVLDLSLDQWRAMFEVNVFGTLKVIRTFIQPMIAKKAGSVINVSTTGTEPRWYRPHSREQPYMASKAAVTNLSIYLADEIREHNIAVNVIFPPHVMTTGTKEQDRLRRAYMGPSTPARPEVVVPLAKFLAAQTASTGVTGQVIFVGDWNLYNGYGPVSDWLADMGND